MNNEVVDNNNNNNSVNLRQAQQTVLCVCVCVARNTPKIAGMTRLFGRLLKLIRWDLSVCVCIFWFFFVAVGTHLARKSEFRCSPR
jgi:hypothetical protein